MSYGSVGRLGGRGSVRDRDDGIGTERHPRVSVLHPGHRLQTLDGHELALAHLRRVLDRHSDQERLRVPVSPGHDLGSPQRQVRATTLVPTLHLVLVQTRLELATHLETGVAGVDDQLHDCCAPCGSTCRSRTPGRRCHTRKSPETKKDPDKVSGSVFLAWSAGYVGD